MRKLNFVGTKVTLVKLSIIYYVWMEHKKLIPLIEDRVQGSLGRLEMMRQISRKIATTSDTSITFQDCAGVITKGMPLGVFERLLRMNGNGDSFKEIHINNHSKEERFVLRNYNNVPGMILSIGESRIFSYLERSERITIYGSNSYDFSGFFDDFLEATKLSEGAIEYLVPSKILKGVENPISPAS